MRAALRFLSGTCRSVILLLVLFGWPFHARAQTAVPATPSPLGAEGSENWPDVATVRLDGRPLFRVGGLQTHPAAERAVNIANRIAQAAADPSVSPDSLGTTESDLGTQILAGDRPLLVVTSADAHIERLTRAEAVQFYLLQIRHAIEAYRVDRSADRLLAASARAAGATAGLALFLFVVHRLGRRIRSTLQSLLRNRSVKIHSFELMRGEGAGGFVDGVVHLAGVLLALISIFFYCDYALSLFPWTRAAAANMLGYVLDPLRSMGTALLNYLPSLLFLAVLALVTRFVLSVLRLIASRLAHGPEVLSGFHPEWAWPTYRLVRIVVIVFAAVVAFPYIPFSDSEAFKGISIFLGVLLSLGSSSLIGNLIAGYTLIYWRALRVGDRVQIGDVIGAVSETGILVTRVRTPKNEDVVIPNTTILSGKIVNYSSLAKEPGLILHTTVGIGYETPWRQVEAMLLAAAERTPGLLQKPKPFVLQRALGDFAVTYEINVYTDAPHVMLETYHALHRSILDVFNEYGVQIMVPAYEGDPAEAKVVPKERWHESPATPPGTSKDPTRAP